MQDRLLCYVVLQAILWCLRLDLLEDWIYLIQAFLVILLQGCDWITALCHLYCQVCCLLSLLHHNETLNKEEAQHTR